MTTKVKIYGLRRSGTHLLLDLVRRHLDVPATADTGGWRHGPITPMLGKDTSRLVIVATVRHPIPWLHSMWRLSQKIGWWPEMRTFEDFIYWNTRGNPTLRTEKVSPWIVKWTYQCAYWLHQPAWIVHHEDLVLSAEAVISALANEYQIKIKSKPTLPEEFVGPHGKGRARRDVTRELTEEKYMEAWTPELLEYVRGRIDHRVMHELGYEWRQSWQAPRR